jgi:hypothetical protein
MADRRFEYQVEPVFVSPDELRNDRFRLEEALDEYAAEGWVLDEALRVDSSTFLFIFARPAG